jgi:hypothetical protein
MIQDFLTIDYLEHGNELQQKVYHLLQHHQILEKLKTYHPIVVGTIPIEINIANSDIDIIGEIGDFEETASELIRKFSYFHQFRLEQKQNTETSKILVCNFWIDEFEIEIYLENKNSINQNAYRHMFIEHKLLQKYDKTFRDEIIRLKQNGYKTEPAFAKVLHLKGDPYKALLDFEIE